MKKCFSALVVGMLCLFAAEAVAHSYKQGAIEIGHIWARATPPGAKTASVYVPFRNTGGEADSLVGAETPAAEQVMIHESYEEDGIVKMRMLDTVALAPGKPVALRPGGKHLMLIGLKRQLRQGERFPITLHFGKAEKIAVEVIVSAPGSMTGED